MMEVIDGESLRYTARCLRRCARGGARPGLRAEFLAANPVRGVQHVVAIGKAAAPMLEGAQAALGQALRAALLITKPGYATPAAARILGVSLIEAGHPLPDESSMHAGAALLDFIAATPPYAPLLFLLSGGASSLVEVLPAGVSLTHLRRANGWLLGSGLDIHAVNAVRRRLSCIKGGRLASRLGGRRAVQLLISDVAGDDPAAIGSGLLLADEEICGEVDTVVPDWLRPLFAQAPPLAPLSRPAVATHIVATLAHALAAAARAAQGLGYAEHRLADRLCGDAATQGRRLAAELLNGRACIHLWGGETTVAVPDHPGRGGRNQQLALAAALALAGHDKVYLLAAGSDGSDGPGGDAGALVDGATVARGAAAGWAAADCLQRADAGSFLEASGDLIRTGPTGTNVTDLAIGFKL